MVILDDRFDILGRYDGIAWGTVQLAATFVILMVVGDALIARAVEAAAVVARLAMIPPVSCIYEK